MHIGRIEGEPGVCVCGSSVLMILDPMVGQSMKCKNEGWMLLLLLSGYACQMDRMHYCL